MIITKENKAAANKIADYYGLESQISIAQEECSELIQALSKLRRYTPKENSTLAEGIRYTEARCSVAEEMADVINLLLQLSHLLHNEDMVAFWLQFKLARTLNDAEKEESA